MECGEFSGRMPAKLREEVVRSRDAEFGSTPWNFRASVATWLKNRKHSPKVEEPLESSFGVPEPSEEMSVSFIIELDEATAFERSVSSGKENDVWGREVSTGSTEAPGSEVSDLDDAEILEPDNDDIWQWQQPLFTCCDRQTVSCEAISILDSPKESKHVSFVEVSGVSPSELHSMPRPSTTPTLDKLSVESFDGASSVDSLDLWSMPEETMVFFDFDDTLFPTTWMTSGSVDMSSDRIGQTNLNAMERHDAVVSSLLRVAARHGHVALVTLAKRTWIDRAVQTYLPRMGSVLADLQIDVKCARESISLQKFKGAVADGLDPTVIMKRECMRQLLRDFYSQRPRQSWKNCICIGDSHTERDAIDELAFTRRQLGKNGLPKPLRCKTVKLMERPALTLLTSELETIAACFQRLVEFDGDFAYEFSQVDKQDSADFLRELSKPGTAL